MVAKRLGVGGLLLAGLLSGCGGGGSGTAGVSEPDLSGVITIENRTRVDSDTADDSRVGEAVSNNSLTLAQQLPFTGTVGGYLSFTSGTYPGNSEFTFNFVADVRDYYRVDLAEDDRVALQVFQQEGLAAPDVRMIIADTNGMTVYDSNLDDGDGESPFLKVIEAGDADGPHSVEISTSSGGPFRYVLTVAARGATSVMSTSYAEPDFRLGEAIATFEPGSMATASADSMVATLGVADARSLGGGVWKLSKGAPELVTGLSASELRLRRVETLSWIRDLAQRPDIAVAEPNYLYHAQDVTPGTNPLYQQQWHYPLINLPVAWQVAPDAGLGVGVAVMDTGLFSESPDFYGVWHPDIDSNVVSFTGHDLDYVTGDLDIDNQQGRDTNPADPGDGKSQSSNFHGTHVAGIVAAADNTEGGLGVAPSATLWPVRVLGRDGSGSLDDLIAAVNWAGTLPEIDVINLSLGGVGPSSTLRSAIDTAFERGKLVVAAAGNQGTDELTYPAAFERVVGVGAVDGAKVRASYSNIGGSVDLVAPGGDASRDANLDGSADLVISTWGTDNGNVFVPGYAGLQGTSMAAPHVAGVFALMKAEKPDITAEDFFALLANGDLTENVGNQTEYGAGLIDAVKSVDAALDGNVPTVLAASPSVLQFSSALVSQQLDFVRYPTSGPTITVDTVTRSEPWLEVGPELEEGSEPPPNVLVSVDTELLEEGETFSADLVIDYHSSDGERTLTIPVTIQLGDPQDERDAGRHYVLLVSTDDNRETIAQAVVNASEGQYSFAFDDVEPGEYFLVAGTDMDNNGLICENGEACAEYPVNGLPEKIVIGGEPLSGVTLNTSFRRPTIAAMGMPRYGFEGYRLKTGSDDQGEPIRQVETHR